MRRVLSAIVAVGMLGLSSVASAQEVGPAKGALVIAVVKKPWKQPI